MFTGDRISDLKGEEVLEMLHSNVVMFNATEKKKHLKMVNTVNLRCFYRDFLKCRLQ